MKKEYHLVIGILLGIMVYHFYIQSAKRRPVAAR